MGLSAAFHLRRAEPSRPVLVLERAQTGAAASGASAAGVRAMGRDSAERRLALESLARWPGLADELGAPTGYRRGGGLRVALDEGAWRGARRWATLQQEDGVPLEVLDAAATRHLAPGIAPGCIGGVYCPIDGHAEASRFAVRDPEHEHVFGPRRRRCVEQRLARHHRQRVAVMIDDPGHRLGEARDRGAVAPFGDLEHIGDRQRVGAAAHFEEHHAAFVRCRHAADPASSSRSVWKRRSAPRISSASSFSACADATVSAIVSN